MTARARICRLLALGLGAAALGVQAELPCAEDSAGTISYDEIVARYADEDSKFVVLEGRDGIRIHYKDEGQGPAVLLVHTSSGDLRDWDRWAEVLSPNYRVVRLDLPAFGLTGQVPSGNYSIDRYLTLVDALMDHLGIERFAIAGGSYGGLVAFRYAGTRVNRITALVLMNSAGVEYGGRGGTTERTRDPVPKFAPKLRTQAETRAMLETTINDRSKITAALVERKTDFANVAGRDCEGFIATGLYERGDPMRVLGHIRAPALVLWGGNSRALSVSTAQAFIDGMTNAKSTQKIVYDGGGHFLNIERPAATARDVKTFLDDQLL